jgi:hypothetical protein
VVRAARSSDGEVDALLRRFLALDDQCLEEYERMRDFLGACELVSLHRIPNQASTSSGRRSRKSRRHGCGATCARLPPLHRHVLELRFGLDGR